MASLTSKGESNDRINRDLRLQRLLMAAFEPHPVA